MRYRFLSADPRAASRDKMKATASLCRWLSAEPFCFRWNHVLFHKLFMIVTEALSNSLWSRHDKCCRSFQIKRYLLWRLKYFFSFHLTVGNILLGKCFTALGHSFISMTNLLCNIISGTACSPLDRKKIMYILLVVLLSALLNVFSFGDLVFFSRILFQCQMMIFAERKWREFTSEFFQILL